MKKLDCPVAEGWAVHVYGRDRRLLCTLDPSHGWTFLSGLGMGLLLAIIGLNLGHSTSPPEPAQPSSPPAEAPLYLD